MKLLRFWSSLKCIKFWISIYFRGLKFPQRSLFLLLAYSDPACTSLNVHSAWKKAVLLYVWYYKAIGDREQDLWRYWLHEGCIKQFYDKPTGDGCLQELQTGGAMRQWHCCILYFDQAPQHTKGRAQDSIHYDSHHWPDPPFTQLITLCFFYCVSGPWAFCQAVLFLKNVFATKVWSCHELDPQHIIHILGFITPNVLCICFMIMAVLAIFHAWI